MLVLDAVLTGAKGVNLWSSFRGAPPQRKARLYTALVERGLASTVSGALLPTAQPFLYTLSFTAMEGVPLDALEAAALEEIERVRTERRRRRGGRPRASGSSARGWSSRTTASPTSRTSSAISRRLPVPDFCRAAATNRRGDGRAGLGRRAAAARDSDANRRLVPARCEARGMMSSTRRRAVCRRFATVLDNGAVVIVQETSRDAGRRRSTRRFCAGSSTSPADLTGPRVPDRPGHRPRAPSGGAPT